MVPLGYVALDSTKIKANASKHKAMSYGRMQKTAADLATTVQGWLQKAETLDAREDTEWGRERLGDELPRGAQTSRRGVRKFGTPKPRWKPKPVRAWRTHARPSRLTRRLYPCVADLARAQRNFTDPESRIMKTAEGLVQGDNA